MNTSSHLPCMSSFIPQWCTCATLVVILVCSSLLAQCAAQTLPAELRREQLLPIYKAELKDRFEEAKFEKLLGAHRLLEQFFAEPNSTARAGVIRRIEATGVDAVTLGRLCRVRLYWPDLPPGVYYISERVGPHTVAYFLGLPKGYTVTRSWPLVVRLPATEPFVRKPEPDQQEITRIYTDWITEELAQHPDAIVLMPLMNFDHLFGPSYAGVNAVMQPIYHAAARANIDPARVYLIGHSAGAHAAWNLALHYPTTFAAFNAMAGSAKNEFQRLRLRNLRNTWPVVWHDADDDIISVDMSRQLVRALRGQKIDLDYEETKKLGHRPPVQIIDKMYAKLRSRTRPLYPADVMLQSNRLDPIYNRVDWLQIDQPTRPGDDQRVFFTRGTEKIVLQAGVWSATASLKPRNRIELKTDNVELLRLYFNDQMIDFDRAISVVVNGRVRFEGFVKPSITDMLNDQLFLGRGWRYFTAVLPLDLAPPPSSRPATSPSLQN